MSSIIHRKRWKSTKEVNDDITYELRNEYCKEQDCSICKSLEQLNYGGFERLVLSANINYSVASGCYIVR